MTRLVSRAESFETIEQALNQINFSSFDFYTIKNSLIDYVKLQFPENFNDFIESSEFISILEIFSYVIELYNYRLDINASENFLSTAERKQSVLKIAKFLSYNASRNIPGRGLVKLQSIKSTENIFDIDGVNLNNKTIIWNDPNNNKWKDQFILVMNRILKQEFGSVFPDERVQVDDVLFELYDLENIPLNNGVFPFNTTVSGEQLPMELVSSELNEFGPIERRPESNTTFSMLYGSDGLGDSSDTTGFFAFTKQGEIQRQRHIFDGVTPNQTLTIDTENINDSDIWINNVNPVTGEILNDNSLSKGKSGEWHEVDISHAQNIIFNTNPSRNKFEIETLENDKIKIIFGDGEFADIPNGSFDIWIRSSIDKNVTIPRSSITNNNSSLSYIGRDGNIETFSFTYSLINSIQNNSATEDIEHIRKTAPAVYYTQDRMVNSKDYNTFMLQDTSILKLRSLNRTFIGDSKYITWHEPKESYESVKLFGDDLAIYYKNGTSTNNVLNEESASAVFYNQVEPLLASNDFFTLLTSKGITPDNIRTNFTQAEANSIIAAMEQAALSPPQTLQLFYSILDDEWVFLIDESSNTTFDNIFTTDLPFTTPVTALNKHEILFNVISPWNGNTLEAEGLIKILVNGFDWEISHSTQRIICQSPETRFWNTNDANRILSFDTLLSNQDEIIILDANKNANRNDLLENNHHYNVIGQELVEPNIPTTGLVDIHQLSILPIDENGDAVPDNMDLPDIINPSFDLIDNQFNEFGFTTLLKDIDININSTPVFEFLYNSNRIITYSDNAPTNSVNVLIPDETVNFLPNIISGTINYDNSTWKEYVGSGWTSITVNNTVGIPTASPLPYWESTVDNKLREYYNGQWNIVDVISQYGFNSGDIITSGTKWFNGSILYEYDGTNWNNINSFDTREDVYEYDGTNLYKYNGVTKNVINNSVSIENFDNPNYEIDDIWSVNSVQFEKFNNPGWESLDVEVANIAPISMIDGTIIVNELDEKIYKFEDTGWQLERDYVFSNVEPLLPMSNNHAVNVSNGNMYSFTNGEWQLESGYIQPEEPISLLPGKIYKYLNDVYKFDGLFWQLENFNNTNSFLPVNNSITVYDSNVYVFDTIHWELQNVGLTSSASSPTGQSVGDFWLDTSSNLLYKWDGINWDLQVNHETSEPQSPYLNEYRLSSTNLYKWDGTNWDLQSYENITSVPVTPSINEYWYNSILSKLYKWDGTNWDLQISQEINTVPLIISYWFNTDTNILHKWDGANWDLLQYRETNIEPRIFDYWFDSSINQLYQWINTGWSTRTIKYESSNNPIALSTNLYWVNTSSSTISKWNGSQWINKNNIFDTDYWIIDNVLYYYDGSNVTISNYITNYSDPLTSIRIYRNENNVLYSYDIVTGWYILTNVQVSNSEPSNNLINTDLFYDSIDDILYKWNGTIWEGILYYNNDHFYTQNDNKIVELSLDSSFYNFDGISWNKIANYDSGLLTGEYWYELSTSRYYIYDGSSWIFDSYDIPELYIDSINVITGNGQSSISIQEYVYFQREEIDLDTGEFTWIPKKPTTQVIGAYIDDLPAAQHQWKRENGRFPMNFLWMHRTPRFNLIDPAATNIIDTYIISRSYYTNVLEWLTDKTTIVPEEPTSLQLRTDYNELIESKMISDTIILHSGKIKILFGNKSIEQLQAKFKIIRKDTSRLTNNQIKTKVIGIIKEFFDINQWEFGETFYMTELASKIHINMIEDIKSVVLVPIHTNNLFGDLFIVPAREDEIFQPHIGINDIEIVSNYTSENINQEVR